MLDNDGARDEVTKEGEGPQGRRGPLLTQTIVDARRVRHSIQRQYCLQQPFSARWELF